MTRVAIAHFVRYAAAVGLSMFSLIALGACGGRATAELPVLSVERPGQFADLNHLDGLTLNASTVSLPTELAVYVVQKPTLDATAIAFTARALGISGGIHDTDTEITYGAGQSCLTFYKTDSSFDYFTPKLDTRSDAIRVRLSDAEYRSKAEAFLRDNGLMRNDAEFAKISYEMSERFENGKWVERPCVVDVWFMHKALDGVPFRGGVGPWMTVQFGENGEIISSRALWRDVTPFKVYPLITVADAVAAVVEGRGTVAGLEELEGSDTGAVDEVSVFYFNEGVGHPQTYVLPWYSLKGKTSGGVEFNAVIPAVPEKYLDM